MSFTFSIPTEGGASEIQLEPGASAVFVGANGSGKTRLAVKIENALGDKGHRIAAHRALTLNPDVPKISEEAALRGLRYGNQDPRYQLGHREGFRWGQKAATHLLNDFDFVVQALFAEQANTALKTHNLARGGVLGASPTKFEQLKETWERLLPHRRLVVTGDRVDVVGEAEGVNAYSASEMSDGERTVFYMMGQALIAPPDCVLVVDEPELHVHPSVLGKLWDEVQVRCPLDFVFRGSMVIDPA